MTQVLKIIVLGYDGVGKSAITQRFIYGKFIDYNDPLIEDNYKKAVEFDNNVFVLDIVDSASWETYNEQRDSILEEADGFILVYSIASEKSYLIIPEFIHRITRIRDDDNFPMIIVGNKCDLEGEREISTELGVLLARRIHRQFLETSAFTNENINEIFESLVSVIYNRRRMERKIKCCTLF